MEAKVVKKMGYISFMYCYKYTLQLFYIYDIE